MGTIPMGKDRPLSFGTGTIPDVAGGLTEYFQTLTFERIVKTVVGFQVVEKTHPISFQGLIQPYSKRLLIIKPEGQRAWTWFTLHAQPVFTLQVDDVVVWNGKQTRVMARTDYALYGYVEYELVQDWTGSGPTAT